ncbi:MAG: acyl CoA:acetate/3-ketoacid CoA transferase [Clostridiales bacterium]|jgi:propionate CoA-transferase|nr:acyl CoA:acetate/3-ketoacid CoA transferase [Clostridiales bacterium]
MAKIITARQAAELIPDGATVGVGGMGLSGWPEEVAQAIASCYRETGRPKGLNIKQGSAMGDWRERGMTVLGIEGLATRWSGAHIGSAFAMNDLVRKNKMQCHCLPQGAIVNLWREIAAKRPGILTKAGLGTFVDPRLGGGKMNDVTTDELVELVTLLGEEYLLFKSFPLHVALLRGTTADENGNVTFEHESVINEGLAIAEAAHNSGGISIVQVEYLAQAGTLNPKDVRIPGILVDYVVLATKQEACWQAEGIYFEPSFSGQLRKPLSAIPPIPLSERKFIARRCAMELRGGDVVNLGVGLATDVSNIVAEEKRVSYLTLTSEAGAIGGVPSPLPNFGSSYNPDATIDHGSMFDLIDGGGLDITVLGMGEADQWGNVNVSKLGSRLTGPGGFINITQATNRLVFCGTLMNKSKSEIKDNEIRIVDQGAKRKFVSQVEQITFSGKYARPEQKILYVTERCVFQLINGKMTLIEIAPGIDLEKDILSQMDFVPAISEDLKVIDKSLLGESWGGLGEYIKNEQGR